jgi:hypothetical protein
MCILVILLYHVNNFYNKILFFLQILLFSIKKISLQDVHFN